MRATDPPPAKRPPPVRPVIAIATAGKRVADEKVRLAGEQFTAGVGRFREGAFEDALTAFDFVARALPARPDGWHNKGVALLMLKRFPEAVSAFDAAIRIEVEESDSWDGRGCALGEVGRLDEALQSHDRALQYRPRRPDYWHNRGLAHFAMGHHWQAVESFDKAIAIDLNRFDTWQARAMAQAKMGRPQGELLSVEQMVRIDPQSLASWRLRIALLEKLERPKEARAARLDLYRAGKDDPDLQFEHAMRLMAKEKDERAAECFREAARLDPSRSEARLRLAQVLERAGKHADALAAADALLALAPASLEGLGVRARSLSELGRLDEALVAADSAARASPTALAGWELLADLAKRADRPDLIERALRGARSVNRRDVPTLHDLGVVLGRQGRTREALAVFDEALRASPNSVEVLYSKGALLEAQDQFRDALDLYREVLRYHPGHKKATARKAEVEKRLGIAPPPARPAAKPKSADARGGHKPAQKKRRPDGRAPR